MKILALNPYYLPGYKAGGPIRTLANMVERMGPDFEFRIIARDRDYGDSAPYSSVVPSGEWQAVGKAGVRYLDPARATFGNLRQLLSEENYDVLYLNSFFSFRYTIVPLLLRRAGLIPRQPVVIAPRGEFSPGALALKSRKKHLFILAARSLGLYGGLVWQASSKFEGEDIRRWFGPNAVIHIAPNIPAIVDVDDVQRREEKRPGRLRVVFLSRIAEMKNLLGALDIIRSVRGTVEFDIYGTVTESAYWEKCRNALNEMPAHVRVQYRGSVSNEEVYTVLSTYEVLLLPTFGENFGHVIPEALSAGCPVLISDQTPWRGLDRCRVGWDLPLSNRDRFVKVLQRLADMDESEHSQWRSSARRFAAECMDSQAAIAENEALFRRAAGFGQGPQSHCASLPT